MTRFKMGAAAAGVLVVLIVGCVGVYQFRRPISYLFPTTHTGTVLRIADFHKGGWSSRNENTGQLRQFAIFFEDGFDCEASDTSFAAVREGDVITIKGYHDVRGIPFIDPEWWECDEAQLERLHPPTETTKGDPQ